jgi:anti-sigma B factor antagonist
MAQTESSLTRDSTDESIVSIEHDAHGTVVRLRGEHDASSASRLASTLAQAVQLDGGVLVVDLSAVTFMDAATIGVLLNTNEFLVEGSRSLVLRAPSTRARRIVDLCNMSDLIEAGPRLLARPEIDGALATWVEVPPTERSDGMDAPAVEPVAASEPARSGSDGT